jgi:protein-S-isoprenylcysteine O-methyltransferase Ste14
VNVNMVSWIVGGTWVAFWLAWAICAMVFGGGGQRSFSAAASGVGLVIVVSVFVGFIYAPRWQPSGGLADELAIAGAALCVVGLAFAVWARIALGRSWGMPMTQHADPELVTHGPHRYVRHPIYAGLSVILIGTALVYPSAVALPCALMIAYSVFSARREERDMERFPSTYAEYKQLSKFLVPFLF